MNKKKKKAHTTNSVSKNHVLFKTQKEDIQFGTMNRFQCDIQSQLKVVERYWL